MTNGEFTKQVQPIITGQGYGCGNCNQCNVHWDSESGAGYGTGSGRIDGTCYGAGWSWGEAEGSGFGRGQSDGLGSCYCTGGGKLV